MDTTQAPLDGSPAHDAGPLGNLPSSATVFLGREAVLPELADSLNGSHVVTLTGSPGIGKSRLGIELAHRVAAGYPDGAWLVGLAGVGDEALVPGAMASALAINEKAGQSVTDTLVGHLGQRHLLLLLDNCEHLLRSCARLAETLLESCGSLTILATSREPLGIAKETVWQVPPLSVPDHSEAVRVEELVHYEAVRLFVERARAVEPGFALNAHVAPAVVEICRRLDGIPLAIELAAARVQQLTPADIARRLDDRFTLLADENSELDRHRTLATALDWSYELLSAPERTLLRRVSVFAGGLDLEAAAAVCAGGELEPERIGERLDQLVAKSLLVVDPGAGRYRMLETIRAYGAAWLEQSGEVAELREAHARYFMALAERAEPELEGADQVDWFDRLEAERTNLRSALEWSLDRGQTEWALRLAGSLVLFWRVRCHFSEGLNLLQAAVSSGDGARGGLRAKALWGLGFLALMADDIDRAVPALEESLAGYRVLGDRRGLARVLLILGNCRQYQGEPTAEALFEESAALAREGGDSWCLAHALGVAGWGLCMRGELADARPLLEECITVARAAKDKQGLRWGVCGLGMVAGNLGDYDSAEPLLEEAVAITKELREPYFTATALQYLAQVAFGRGRYRRAAELLDEALALIHEVGPPVASILPLVLRAQVAVAEGETAQARLFVEEALPLARVSPGAHTYALVAMAEVAAREGDRRAAQRLFEEAVELAESIDAPRSAAGAIQGLACMARAAGDPKQAAALHGRTLELHHQTGNLPGIVSSLEALAGALSAAGNSGDAARLFGAAGAIRDENGYARPPWERGQADSDLALIRQALSDGRLKSAFATGAAWTVEEAVTHAEEGRRGVESFNGAWQSLTETERKVAGLVAEGMTNREVAGVLFVSPATVRNHLSHIFSKLGIGRRMDLARQVSSSAGRKPPPD